MRNIITRKILSQMISVFFISLICLPGIDSSAFALSKEELLAYRGSVKDIMEESMLRLKPGTLKNEKMSQEEKQKLTVALIKSTGAYSDTKLYDTLTYYSMIFRECAIRLENEVDVHDLVLLEWHKKLVAGYKDSGVISEYTLKQMRTPDNAGFEIALSDKLLMKRIRDNQTYHHNIQNELDNLIRSILPGDPEVQRLSRELTGLYVETTWK